MSYKTCFSKNKWNKVKVYAYVSKDCLFLQFWIIIGGSKCAIVTANRPKVNVRDNGFELKPAHINMVQAN